MKFHELPDMLQDISIINSLKRKGLIIENEDGDYSLTLNGTSIAMLLVEG